MVTEEVVLLEGARLAALLRDPAEAARTLLLDCRPFLAFCRAHVRDARPVHWNALLRRRARGRGGLGLERLLPEHQPILLGHGGPVEILPFLFLGSCHHSSNREVLESLGITAVLNVSSSCPNYFEGQFLYKSIPVEDNHMAEISVWFQEAINFIDAVKSSGGRVLLHCQAGVSRSATICLAYLIQSRRVRLEEAFDFVKQRRGVISPNFGFMGQLLQFETEVLCH
ncbi:dual specificity protein phosphatase 2 [Varanus komodoensis]|uniref:dual specificity protein phosphatase 2 n=1 Tax=Varanus komodoensis TaxID=61221 RepID=UPI001CF7AFEE|nr:dual specificity protein phosphatase 2 [Varanus komodoensis]